MRYGDTGRERPGDAGNVPPSTHPVTLSEARGLPGGGQPGPDDTGEMLSSAQHDRAESAQRSAFSTQHSSHHSSHRSATAVWFPRARHVELREERLAPVGQADVRVRAIVSALSHGTEMLVLRGQVHPDLDLDLPTLEGSFRFPIKYGYASVGRVVEVGGEVRSLAIGDLVFAHHPHQTEYVVPATFPVLLSAAANPEEAALLANLETAVNVILDSGIRLGDRVVVFGQGVVGLLLAQLARLAGARTVIAVDPLPLRRELALAVGAHVVLTPDDDLPARISDLTDGTGADVVLEASGRGAALDRAVEIAAFQGTVVVCSWYGTQPVELYLGGAFHRNRIRLVSSQVSSIDPALQPRWTRARRVRLALELMPELRLAPLVTHRIPFGQAPEAYRLVDEHPEQVVQLLLTYEEQDV
jgi:2-desacetyl-2-hydroxyethyl bacteriochlorophyllide A dehydrogenase